MIGTNHLDPKGPERLGKLLDFMRPDTISVEYMAEDAAETLKGMENARRTVRGAGFDIIRRWGPQVYGELETLLTLQGYELEVGTAYANAHPETSIYYTDRRSEKLRGFGFEEISETLKETNPSEVMATLQEAKAFSSFTPDYHSVVGKEVPVTTMEKFELVRRDAYAAEKIRELAQDSHTLVHIGGNMHMFATYAQGQLNLYERLIDLQPNRVLLSDADKF